MFHAYSSGVAVLLLIAAVAGQGTGCGPELGENKGEDKVTQRVNELIQVFAHPESRGENFDESVRAMRELAAIGEPAVPQLMQAMLDPNHDISAYSANALDKIGTRAVKAVRARWPELNEAEKWKFMRFRGKFDYEAVLDFALKSLQSKDPQVRRRATEYLCQHREVQARPVLLKMLHSESEVPQVRLGLVGCLASMADEEVVDTLIALLAPDSWVAKGVGNIHPPGYPPPWWPDGRQHVIQALHTAGAKRSAPALVKVLEEKGPGAAYFSRDILPALGEFGDPRAIPAMRRILLAEDKDILRWASEPPRRVRARAARHLWQLHDRSGLLLIGELLRAANVGDRQFACETLSRFGDRSDLWMLAACLDDPDEEVLKITGQGLERITGVVIRAPGRAGAPFMNAADAAAWKAWYEENREKDDAAR